jgi:hypothetical protein
MIGYIIVILILVVAFLAYRLYSKSGGERIRNILGNSLWQVDRSGVGGGASYYIKFGRFTGAGVVGAANGKVKFTKYGINKEFEYESELEWTDGDASLRVGQMKFNLVVDQYGRPPTVKMLSNVEDANPWEAPLKEIFDAPSKKL